MNVLKTLQFMKPDIKVMVWENDIDRIVYNETETFRPTKEEILAVSQVEVETQDAIKEQIKKDTTVTFEELLAKVIDLETEISILKAK